jgi:hypothetical protein
MAKLRRFSPDDLALLRFMADRGHSGNSIAARLGVTPGAVRNKCCELGIRLRPNAKPKFGSRFKIRDALRDALHAAAAKRGMRVTRFTHLVLETITRDKLFDAILDVPVKIKANMKPVARTKPRVKPAPWGVVELGARAWRRWRSTFRCESYFGRPALFLYSGAVRLMAWVACRGWRRKSEGMNAAEVTCTGGGPCPR